MTAEFAVALPAVILVLAIALGGMELVGAQLRLQGAVADAARLLGRGDSGAAAVLRQISPGAELSSTARGGLVCAAGSTPASLGLLPGVTLRAAACALSDPEPGAGR